MARGRVSRKTARARKSTGIDMTELQEMIKTAVKEVNDEEKSEGDEGDEGDEEKDDAEIADILDEALAVVAEKRKSAKADDVATEDADDLIDAVLDAVEGKSDEDDIDLVATIEEAVEAVNAKRKSAKADGLPDELVDEVIDAVAEVMSDGEANEEGKRRKSRKNRKSTTYRRQTKSARSAAPARQTQRKYSNFYMSNRGGSMGAEQKKVPANIQLARAVKCLDVFGKNDPERAAYFAKKHYQDTAMEREFKTLSATSPTSGGFLIPEIYSDQIIELLYPKTVIVELGAQTVPLTNGNLTMPKMTAGSRARWGGEQRKIRTTEPKFGNIKLSAKRLEAIVPQSREILMSTNASADAMFANDLTRQMQLGLDYGGLYGTGGDYQPLGVAYTKGIENIDLLKLGNADLVDASGKITADFPVYVRSILLSKNVDDIKVGWAMNSMLEGYLMNLKTTTGAYIYREEMQGGKFLGFAYAISNQIPTNKNGFTDLFFGNWADLLIGDQMGLETYTTMDGSWTDEDGNTRNAFDENLAATRALMYDDIGVRHDESFVYCKNIKVF